MEPEPSTKQRYSSRKFWTMIFFGLLFTAMKATGKIEGDIYEGLMWVAIGGYFLGNVGEHISRRMGK